VFEQGAFDAATCIGATFIFGGFQADNPGDEARHNQKGR